jgi:hypothetical protein
LGGLVSNGVEELDVEHGEQEKVARNLNIAAAIYIAFLFASFACCYKAKMNVTSASVPRAASPAAS